VRHEPCATSLHLRTKAAAFEKTDNVVYKPPQPQLLLGNSGNWAERYTMIANSSVCSSRRWTTVSPCYVRETFYSKNNERKVTSSLWKLKYARMWDDADNLLARYKTGGNTSMGVYQNEARLVGRNFFGYKKRDPPCDTLHSFGQLRSQAFSRSLHSISDFKKNQIIFPIFT
jgi:hypothetical protein